MPHKHKRDKSKNESSYDLPPTKTAHPLPVKKSTPTTTTKTTQPSKKRKRPNTQDDTPRAFARLLNPTTYRPPRSGLDDGTTSKKRKTTTTTTKNPNPPPPSTVVPPSLPTPKILPHEPLSSFSARVDAALPFTNISKNSNNNSARKDIPDRGRQTKTERKMQRMQREWREEEKRRKEKMEEEELEGDVDEEDALLPVSGTKKKKKGKGKRMKNARAEDGEEEHDIWAGIKAKPIYSLDPQRGLVGLHDVVQAPPKLLKGKMKVRENSGSGFGKKSGGGLGLKREDELREARRGVVEGYRALMRERREAV